MNNQVPNLIIRKRLKDANITLDEISLHTGIGVRTLQEWIAEPLYKSRTEIIYRAMEEIKFHRMQKAKRY